MAVVTVPLHRSIGARIYGVDLAKPLDEASLAEIAAALDRWHVLVFPEQDLTPQAQIDFSRRFGELELYPQAFSRAAGHPEIFMVSTVDEDGRQIPLDDPRARFLKLTERWHSDSSFQACPSRGSVLYAIEVPAEWGDMLFADLKAAWRAMPEGRRRQVQDLRAVHDFARSRVLEPDLPPLTVEEAAAVPPVNHPLVRRHADGSASLFLSDWITGIDGLAADASERMLGWLTGWATSEQFVYRHRWKRGDLVIYDNTCTLNAVEPFDRAAVRRVLRRTTIKGAAGAG